ncbi:MAG: hypothetical protein ACI9G1_000541 [Pirellulaceae bacterium]|jgi:hypothetical protein
MTSLFNDVECFAKSPTNPKLVAKTNQWQFCIIAESTLEVRSKPFCGCTSVDSHDIRYVSGTGFAN